MSAEDADYQPDDNQWCADQRARVTGYLEREGIVHGQVGDWPAWHTSPYVAVWAIESVKWPGSVGWWVISGDLPTDYCTSDDCRHPRLAMKRIAESWLQAIASTDKDDDEIHGLTLSTSVMPLLKTRAELLLEIAAEDENWGD